MMMTCWICESTMHLVVALILQNVSWSLRFHHRQGGHRRYDWL